MRHLGFLSLAFALLPMSAKAMSCEHFKAGVIEGAAMHQSPAPTFHILNVNSASDNKYWDIQMFDDVRARVSCRQGSVDTFAATAKDSHPTSSLHLASLMAIALHGYGLEWRAALLLRDRLVSTAEASNPRMAKMPFGARRASLVVSVAGVPNFEIDTK